MSNEKTFREWCRVILPIIQAAANGEAIEVVDSGKWVDKSEHIGFDMYHLYRIKPKTVRIGEYDVPAPVREAPAVGEFVYLVSTARPIPAKVSWYPNEFNLYLLASGLLHKERTSAKTHLAALVSLTKVGL